MTICTICKSADTLRLLERDNVPRSGQFLTESSIDGFATASLKWTACKACGAISLDQSDLGKVDYTNVIRGTAKQLPEYRNLLVSMVQSALDGAGGGRVIEIGANDGTFLRFLQDHGVSQLCGVEPSLAFGKNYDNLGIPFINFHLTSESAIEITQRVGSAAVVVCRHTLEHVPNPEEFLVALRSLMTDRNSFAIIEVPDTEVLAYQGFVHELWDEHLHYFSEFNLRILCAKSGLKLHEVHRFRHLGSGNILVIVCPTDPCDLVQKSPPEVDAQILAEKFENLSRNLTAAASAWRGTVACLGASHPQSNFLSFSGAARFVEYMIDDDPEKIGRYVPLLGRPPVRVISSKEFVELEGEKTLISTAFGYPEWSAKIRASCGGILNVVDPYSLV